jgi:hypothetical protein
MLSDKDKELVHLEKEPDEFKIKRQTGLQGVTIDDKTIDEILKITLSIPDGESPENLRLFLRSYIEKIPITGDALSIKYTFRESPDSCQVMVPGAGIEPAWGLPPKSF